MLKFIYSIAIGKSWGGVIIGTVDPFPQILIAVWILYQFSIILIIMEIGNAFKFIWCRLATYVFFFFFCSPKLNFSLFEFQDICAYRIDFSILYLVLNSYFIADVPLTPPFTSSIFLHFISSLCNMILLFFFNGSICYADQRQ